MSWGGTEFSSETFYDSYFTQPGVVYFAAAGDSPGVILAVDISERRVRGWHEHQPQP
jgi:hypothetical protein